MFKPYKPVQAELIPKLVPPTTYPQGVSLQGSVGKTFSPSFVFLILGRPGSGKTSLLSQLINRPQFYGKKFCRILYITPSNIQGVLHDQEINTNRTLDARWIIKKLQQCAWAKNVLLVLDDVVADIPAQQRNELKTIFYDRRHLLPKGCLSIIVTSQKYTCVPMWVRVCLTQSAIFGIQPNEVKNVSQQLNTGKTHKQLGYLFRQLKKHQFLFFNHQTGQTYDYQFNRI